MLQALPIALHDLEDFGQQQLAVIGCDHTTRRSDGKIRTESIGRHALQGRLPTAS
jgi:hypothetical protein